VHIPYATAYASGFEDMQRRVPNISRIHALLGWQHERSLDDILQTVIAYERHQSRQK
jgi:UDP-glucose 4-epimerase